MELTIDERKDEKIIIDIVTTDVLVMDSDMGTFMKSSVAQQTPCRILAVEKITEQVAAVKLLLLDRT